MANLQHLSAALGKVADAYAPYAPDPNDDPDATDDPEDDPADDDGDPLDDPRSYTDDDEDPNSHDDEDDFSRPKPFRTIMLLQQLQLQAGRKEFEPRKQAVLRATIPPPLTKLQQKNEKLFQMRRKAAEVEAELRLNRQLEVQSKRLQQASLELYKANKTDQDRKELEADTERMATWASRFCAEAAPDWREQATLAFQNKKL